MVWSRREKRWVPARGVTTDDERESIPLDPRETARLTSAGILPARAPNRSHPPTQ